MSLIIEDKDRLNSLADSIINANGSNATQPATVEELKEQINNFIPLKSKFASGIFTPSEDITSANAPRINFALGNDESGKPIKPNIIIAYQPFAMTDPTPVNASIYRIYTYGTALVNPVTYPQVTLWNASLIRKLSPSASGTYYTGWTQNGSSVADSDETGSAYVFNNSGFLLKSASDTYPFLAGHPIVWLQIKL